MKKAIAIVTFIACIACMIAAFTTPATNAMFKYFFIGMLGSAVVFFPISPALWEMIDEKIEKRK